MRPNGWTWVVFPALAGVVVVLTGMLLERGLPLPAVSSSVLVGVLVVVLVLERVFPLHRAWNARPAGSDLALLLVNRLVDVGLLASITVGLVALEQEGVVPVALRVWPTGAPLVAQAGLGILVGEVVRYVLHRYSHRPGLWWSWHAVHHQPERMYALNGPRLHPANQAWVSAAHALPMLLLGADVRAVVYTAIVTAFFVVLQHANVHLSFTGWNRIFATPDVHRLHHARRWAARGVNYGIVIVVLDRLFGTYAPPVEVAESEIGLSRNRRNDASYGDKSRTAVAR